MLLRADNLTKRYGPFTALDALTFAVAPGEVVGLLGPNGSGKTTALRLIMGFLRPTSGRASVGGHDCWDDSVAARRLVAYLPGELRLYENMTGRQLIAFLSSLRGHPVEGELDTLARRFDIDLERPIATLSSGMKRKVALLQVLTPHAKLVIMDEPTNALDPTMRDQLLGQVLEAKRRGQAVLFSSHVMEEVQRVSDRVLILRRGRLVHEQDLSRLEEGRVVHVRFAGPVVDPPALPGLRERGRRGDTLTLEYTGPVNRLLGWLAGVPLVELRMEPLGLGVVYHRYHGNAE